MLKVLGRVTSINVRKVLWALDELGLVYEREDWGLPLRDPKVPEFLALNPNGQVPVLVEGEFVLWESNAILIYLAEQEERLLPRRLDQRGRALQWTIWQATELVHAGYPVHALIRKTPGYDDAKKLAEAIAKWTAKMQLLEAELGKAGPYLAGDQFSIADIAVGLTVHRWFCVPIEKPALPAVQAYYERLLERPAGARWMTAETP